jgi:adenylate cyclase
LFRISLPTRNPKDSYNLQHSSLASRITKVGASAVYGIDDQSRAPEWATRALSLEPDEALILYNVGCVFSLLNDSDKAMVCLQKALKGYGHGEWLKHDPDLRLIRNGPRFRALMESFH